MQPLRFALVADIHIGPEALYEGKIRKLSRFSLDYLDSFVELVLADRGEPEFSFVVQLGDLIEDADAETDRANIKAGLSSFARLEKRVPVLHVLGNHEQVNLQVPELSSLVGREKPYYSLALAHYHLIVLFSASRSHTDIHIDEKQLAWLECELAATNRPVLVFVHHPLDEQSLRGNVWFERYPDYCFVEERAAVREVLERSGKVLAVFGGHVHQNSVSTIGSIHYCTVQSLVENIGEEGRASFAYAFVEISEEGLAIEVFGADSLSVVLPLESQSED